MSSNRISKYFGKRPCKCCRVRRKLEDLRQRCEAIEMVAGDCLTFFIPSVESWTKGKRVLRLIIGSESDDLPVTVDLRACAVSELRRISLELSAAADRVAAGGDMAPIQGGAE